MCRPIIKKPYRSLICLNKEFRTFSVISELIFLTLRGSKAQNMSDKSIKICLLDLQQLQTIHQTLNMSLFCFLPGCCFHHNRNKMFMMFQEGRQHCRLCVNIEICSCISVQLRSVEFFFDLHLSIQDKGEVPTTLLGHHSSDKGLGKQANLCLSRSQLPRWVFKKWSLYLLLIASCGWWRC